MSIFAKLSTWLREKRWARWTAYAAFSWLVFSLSLFLTFPSDAVKERVVGMAQRSGLRLRVESVNLAFPPGLTLRDSYLILRDADPEAQKGAVAIHISKLTVRPSLLGLLTGKPGISFDARLWDGKVSGKAGKNDEGGRLQVRASGLDLAQSVLGAIGLQAAGKVDELRLEVAGANLREMVGELTIKGEGLVIEGGSIAEFELPKVALGTLAGKIAIADGKAEFENFEANGEDLSAAVDGTIRLADRLSQFTVQTRLRFRPTDEFWARNEMLRAGASIALKKDDEGFHTVQLYGQLTKPRFRLN
jgi:type II secretion system protein N